MRSGGHREGLEGPPKSSIQPSVSEVSHGHGGAMLYVAARLRLSETPWMPRRPSVRGEVSSAFSYSAR